jgi:molybdopterin-guanine dinucleotide biosynthesis protein
MLLPNALFIGGLEKKSGKTTLSVSIVKKFSKKQDIYVIKATIIRDYKDKKLFSIIEETDPNRPKDTGRLLAAGAKKVFWFKTDEKYALSGFKEILEKDIKNKPVLCETNSMRKYIKPGIFLMVKRENYIEKKETAEAVIDYVDMFVTCKKNENDLVFEPDIVNKLVLKENKWFLQ